MRLGRTRVSETSKVRTISLQRNIFIFFPFVLDLLGLADKLVVKVEVVLGRVIL